MPGEIDASVLEALRGLEEMLSGVRHFILAVATTLPEAAVVDDEAPEEGEALVRSRLQCMVADLIDPAIESLKSLAAAAPEEAEA